MKKKFVYLIMLLSLSGCTMNREWHTENFKRFSFQFPGNYSEQSKMLKPGEKLSEAELSKQKAFKNARNIDFRIEVNGSLDEAEKKKVNDELTAYIKERFSGKSGSLGLQIEAQKENHSAKLQINFESRQNNLSFNSSSSNMFGFDNTDQLIEKSKKSLNDLLGSMQDSLPSDKNPQINNSEIDGLFDKQRKLNIPASPIKDFETSPSKGSWI